MNFLRRKIMIVTLVTIIIIILIGKTYGGRENISVFENVTGKVTTPIQRFISLGGKFISDITNPVFNVWKLAEENERLKEENQKLQNEIVNLTLKRQELEDLRDLTDALNYVNNNNITNYIACNVIAKDPGNWYNMFTIDAGTEAGITKNSTVINGDGLVGIVYEVSSKWSKVVSLIDNNSRVSFEILGQENDIGVVNGVGMDELDGYLIDPQSNVKKYDKIITSGLGLYPKGILIGYVTDVIIDKDELLKSIRVRPYVDFKKIDRVLVIPNNKD